MPRPPASVVRDMLEAIEGTKTAVSGKSFEDFQNDWLLRHGVQRALEIVSEAARQLPDDLTSDHPAIPWNDIRGIGNILRHEYHHVSDRIVWNVVKHHFDLLETALQRMLESWQD